MKIIARVLFILFLGMIVFFEVGSLKTTVENGSESEWFYTKKQTVKNFLNSHNYELTVVDVVDHDLKNYINNSTHITIDKVTYEHDYIEAVGDFDTVYTVASSVPLFEEEVIQEGFGEGITTYFEYKLVNGEVVDKKQVETVVTNGKQDEIIAIGTGNPGNFTGTLTGYGPDCEGCGGNVACKPHPDVRNGNITFNDNAYGTIRIVAADYGIPCGTVVRITNVYFGPVTAIVLDRGSTINGKTMDLLFSSESETVSIGRRRNVEFNILRWGWN
jgi:3D (Asp-Asp-Asp) domain-containing protein